MKAKEKRVKRSTVHSRNPAPKRNNHTDIALGSTLHEVGGSRWHCVALESSQQSNSGRPRQCE
jgi:hypothetical protein